MLKSLEVVGFKSFAKKTSLEFKSKVTAIVGPNGSGKSNIAEAFRFALGEQSIKSMRGRRGEDLLWNGSQEVPRANRGSVRLVFDNKNKIFKFDFEEVVVERVVNRDGGNEYYLNGTLVRLKDIFELLSEAHIGASSHHIISQGEADRILSASTKERREMIEDALGLKIYQYKREESERKLIKTEENIKQVESLRREIAPHLKFLKKQVEKVEKAESLKLELAGFYRAYLRHESLYISSQKELLEGSIGSLKTAIKQSEEKMATAKKVLENSSHQDEKSRELIRLEDKIENTRREKDTLEREVAKIEGELTSNERAMKRTEDMVHSEDDKVVKLRDVEKLASEIFLDTEAIKKETVLENIFHLVSTISKKIGHFISNYKEAVDTSLLDELVKRNEELLTHKKDLVGKIGEFSSVLEKVAQDYKELKQSIEAENESGREAERLIFKIGAEENELRSELRILEEKENRLKNETEDWKREVQEAGVLLGTKILGFEKDEVVGDGPDFIKNYLPKRDEDRRKLEKMKIRLEELGGAEGGEVMKEYQETVERDEFLNKEIDDLHKGAAALELLIKDLVERLDTEFSVGIEKINKSFQEYFAIMFGGGEAELKIENLKLKNKKTRDLEDLEEQLVPRNSEELQSEVGEEGIEISVSLPKKRIKSLEMLSGGERALTSIALLFALSSVNPPPFIILDETDAALDEANSKKYGDMIENLAKVSQLILITHNRETMSRAGVIYGVTMGRDGVSRLLSIAFDEAVTVAK